MRTWHKHVGLHQWERMYGEAKEGLKQDLLAEASEKEPTVDWGPVKVMTDPDFSNLVLLVSEGVEVDEIVARVRRDRLQIIERVLAQTSGMTFDRVAERVLAVLTKYDENHGFGVRESARRVAEARRR